MLEIIDESDCKINKKGYSKSYQEYLDILKKLTDVPYYNNIYCSLYLGEYIDKYIIKSMGGEELPYSTVRTVDEKGKILTQEKPIDFLLDWNGKRLNVKSSSSCLVIDERDFSQFWKFNIKFNSKTDAFLLVCFDTRESIEPCYMWFIMKDSMFETEKTVRQFWDRDSILIRDNNKDIAMLKEYELKEQLVVLKKLMSELRKSRDIEIESDISLLLLRRQRQLISTGHKVSLRKIAENAIIDGIDYVIL